jgi:polyhydroxybutyrate depolymerase
MRILFWLLLLFLAAACKRTDDPTAPQSSLPYPDGLSTNTLQVGGLSRRYLVHKPAGLQAAKAIVLVLHGGGGAGLNVAEPGQHPLAVFRPVADTAKFLVVYAEGSPDVQGNPGWNDCRSDDQSGSQGNDMQFLSQLTAQLSAECQVPAARMFVAGTSNGAVMTYSYVFQHGATVRAVATSSGNLPALPEPGLCRTGPAAPMPILMTHGTSDPAMPAAGGCVANFGGACNRGTVVSQDSTICFWLRLNGLVNTTPTLTAFDVNTSDAGSVQRRVYPGANPVVSFRLLNAGHAVPSRTVFTASSAASGVQNRDIEFAAEAWTFFRRFL